MDISEVHFRRATMDDREGIVTPGLFLDMSPLDSRFDIYMTNKFRHNYLATHRGLVVSFLGLKILDEGRTAWYFGARTRDGYTGLGIQTRLLQYALQRVREMYPVRIVRLGSWDPKFTAEYFKGRKDKRLILQKKTVSIAVDSSKPLDYLQNLRTKLNSPEKTIAILPEQLADYIENPGLARYCPGGNFFFDYYCSEPKAYNKEVFCELLTGGFVSVNGATVTSLSTRSLYRATRGCLRSDLTIDGPDLDTVLYHAIINIEALAELSPNDHIEIWFHLNEHMDKKKFEDFFIGSETGGLLSRGLVPEQYCQASVVELLGL